MAGAAGQAGGGAGWSEALSGMEEGTRLAPAVRIGSEAIFAEPVRVELSEALTQQLIRQARSQGLTLNTLLQGAWELCWASDGAGGCGLGIRWRGGSAEIAGIEQMVGLFINTLPVRCSGGRDGSARLAGKIAGAAVALMAHSIGVGGDPAFGAVGRSVRHADGV